MRTTVLLKNLRDRNRAKATIINAIMVVFVSLFTIVYYRISPMFDESGYLVAGLVYATRYVPLMFLAAFGGAIPGYISVIMVFVYRSVADSAFSYMCFIYTMVVFVMDLLAKRRWFDKWYKVFFVTVVMQNLVGTFWGIIVLLLSSDGVSGIAPVQILFFFLNELPGCLLGSCLIYRHFRYLPDSIKLLFDNGKYYVSPDKLDEEARYIVEGRSKIGHVVTNIIVFEAIVLGISAEFASNTLIPVMKDYSYANVAGVSDEVATGRILSAERLESRVGAEIRKESVHVGREYIGNLFVNTAVNYRYSVRLALLISMIVIPLAAFFNKYAQYRIAKPIRSLSGAVSRIYRSDDESLAGSVGIVHDLEINTRDEIEELYNAIDLTLYRLVEYIQLVKTRQHIEDQLKVAQSANEAKSRFLSNISHEIRTPINAVLGFDEMILRESRDEKVLAYARDIQGSGKTLLALINDILDFSKIEAGKMEIIPVEYDLGSLLNDVVNMSSIRASEKNLKLNVNVNRDIPHILFGDEIRIKQCILNIITNAVKYTEAGSVTISVDYEDVPFDENEERLKDVISLRIRVADTGIGIKKEDMGRLMAAFERIDEKNNRTIEGTGLGISIVVSLLKMMDSNLQVSSEYGKGSVFSFAIEQRVVSREGVGDFSQRVRDSQKDIASYRESFHAPDARILVVDDTRTNLTVIEGLLKQTGIKVDTCLSGREALEKVKENSYNIIFLDHRMPEMDGIQTFHAMEKLEDNLNTKTPVIALTANAISGSREMYLREGFNGYMSKPVEPAKLEEMIISFLPKELISRPGDPGYDDTKEADADETRILSELLKIRGIDVSAAIERCGSPSTAREVMKDFYLAIDERAGLIEKYEEEKDIKNYTIYVHGLKSSARAVGALDLADKAEYLEICGNGGDIEEIEMLTPRLLELYRSYTRRFESLFADDRDLKPEISEEELEGAFASIREFVSASYFDSADDIMKMLDSYRVPEKYQEKYHNVKRLLAAVDRDGLLNIL